MSDKTNVFHSFHFWWWFWLQESHDDINIIWRNRIRLFVDFFIGVFYSCRKPLTAFLNCWMNSVTPFYSLKKNTSYIVNYLINAVVFHRKRRWILPQNVGVADYLLIRPYLSYQKQWACKLTIQLLIVLVYVPLPTVLYYYCWMIQQTCFFRVVVVYYNWICVNA